MIAYERGDPRFRAGLTSLALLSFLGNGQTHRFGQYKRTVHRSLKWLREAQRGDGSIGFDPADPVTIYNHALAALALAEAYAISRDFTIRGDAQAATDRLIGAQRADGGWGYRGATSDAIVTGWAVLALKAAKVGQLTVPDAAFDGARSFLDSVTAQSGAVGYTAPDGRGSFIPGVHERFDTPPGPTAVSVVARILGGERRTAPAVVAGLRELRDQPPRWPTPTETAGVDFHYFYFGTHASFLGETRAHWRPWNEAMQQALLPTQRGGPGDEAAGCADGSWDPVGPWCVAGGRVYATAMATLTLEIYYRYERAQK